MLAASTSCPVPPCCDPRAMGALPQARRAYNHRCSAKTPSRSRSLETSGDILVRWLGGSRSPPASRPRKAVIRRVRCGRTVELRVLPRGKFLKRNVRLCAMPGRPIFSTKVISTLSQLRTQNSRMSWGSAASDINGVAIAYTRLRHSCCTAGQSDEEHAIRRHGVQRAAHRGGVQQAQGPVVFVQVPQAPPEEQVCFPGQ